ncbi:DNA cytosine methyltransferase [Brevundimonas diminuta]|uniref:DNA cytosine methyltransferase n=1 Tax=Brevundimonas diminuta TaxID=293 RepID=UPI003208091C
MTIRPAPATNPDAAFTACEFFAGGGLAGLGLHLDGAGFRTVLANDIDAAKARAFGANHPDTPLIHGDVWTVTPDQIPGAPDLCWASSPCQDVSLAGARGGLKAQRSGAFWGFWRLMQGLDAEGRAPHIIVLENVIGLLTSGEGQDFAAVCGAMGEAGYTVGALEIDAGLWLPQSRPRLFIIAMRGAEGPRLNAPVLPFHSPRLIAVHARLPEAVKANWAWWRLETPPHRNLDLAAVLEEGVSCFDEAQTRTLLAMLSPLHRARLEAIQASGERRVGAAFRRVRVKDGRKLQRLEMRFDGLAGCLRTPSGGSSRQYVVIVEDGQVALRRLTGREAARLMGVDDAYRLPSSESAALKLMGDAVAVPVVAALTRGLFLPALTGRAEAAA